jgi:phosphoribosylformylglycinamidine (FGAM) synthase-like enzyme
VDLSAIPAEEALREDTLLFSESAGRFIVTIDPANREAFENLFIAMPIACIGRVTAEPQLTVNGLGGSPIVNLTVPALKTAWQKTFGDLI